MSTQINVIVDDGGLSARARQQTQANRWSKLDAEARAKAEQKAKEEQAKQDAKTGSTQDGQRSRSTFRAEEPAAFRFGHPWLLLVPDQGPMNLNGDILGRSNIRGANLFVGEDVQAPNQTYKPLTFNASGGPSGAALLEAPDVMYGYNRIVARSQSIGAKVRYQEFTLEFYARSGRSGTELSNPDMADPASEVVVACEFRAPDNSNMYITMVHSRVAKYPVPSIYCTEIIDINVANFKPGAVNGQLQHFNWLGPPPPLGSWHHYCVVKREDSINGYVNGVPVILDGFFGVAGGSGGATIADAWRDLDPTMLSVLVDSGNYGSNPPTPPAIHGLRFVGKALYPPQGFTPPPVIDRP